MAQMHCTACNAETKVKSLGLGDPLGREWLSTPVFLSREFQVERSLVSYSSWGRKELDRTEQTALSCLFVLRLSLVAQSYSMLCNPLDCSTKGFPIHHQLLELAQIHIH